MPKESTIHVARSANLAAAATAGTSQKVGSKDEDTLAQNTTQPPNAVLAAMVAGDEPDDSEGTDITDVDQSSAVDEDELASIDEEVESGIVFVHQPKCLQCSHLVAFAEKSYKSCHFTAGNDQCPAQSMRVEIFLDTSKIVRNFIRTEEADDFKKLGRLYEALSKKPQWAQRQITMAIQEARAKRNK